MGALRAWLVPCVVILCCQHIGQATISEGRPNRIYTDCLQRAGASLRRYPQTKASDESLEWSCVQSYLWQTAAERMAPRNLTSQQINFLTTLVGEPRSTRAWQIALRSPTVFPRDPRQFVPATNRPFFGNPTKFVPFTERPTTRRTFRPNPQTPPPFRTFRPNPQTPPPFRTFRPNPQTPPTFRTFRPNPQTAPPVRTIRPNRRTRPPLKTTRPIFNFLNNLRPQSSTFRRTKRNDHTILKRSLAGIPRKEYRALTDAERTAVHNALNLAKNTLLFGSYNAYDFIASLHSGVLASGAHGGPAFLGFHRIYILLMDLVICYFDNTNTVRLPYWDNTLDNELTNPTLSIMWHSSFAGQGNGFVSNGPFGSWATLNGPSIRRSVGSGSLMSKSNVDDVLSRSSLVEISRPTATLQYSLEDHHGWVHGWVGGDMGSLNTATNDPVFFMHHAFIDCIWERFRNRQQQLGINPSTDYPNTFQQFNRPTDSIGIIPSISNYQAVSSFYASLATCEWPVCPTCGYSSYLRCINRRCVPILSDEADPCPSCTGDNQYGYNGYQNSYCVNGNCDASEWAYVPVQITYNRPPDYDAKGRYGSYPVTRSRARQTYDIYSPRGYDGPIRRSYDAQSRLPRYTDCGCREGGASSGEVYIQSYGVNYDGYYREYSVVDRRYAISSNIGYVAVRNPRLRAAQAYVSVYDDCGRLCRPTCWNSRFRRWDACSGAVTVTSSGGSSRGYGNSYSEATYQVFDYGVGQSYQYPTYSPTNVYLNYVCDYSGTFPWGDYRG